MEFVTYEQDGYVGIITINRPKALNALNSAVLEELDATFKAVDLIGLHSGRITFVNIFASEAPSSLAASLSDIGIVSMNPFMMRNPSPDPAE